MHKSAEEKVRRLTQNQAKVLKAIVSAPIPVISSGVSGTYISNVSGLRGNALGGTVSALERNGSIQPFGREERQYKWELIDNDLLQARKDDRKTLLEMLDRISR